MPVTIIIGYTRPDPAAGYHPMLSGYRPGAAQDEVSLRLTNCGRPTHLEIVAKVAPYTSPLQWAEALFIATNAPMETLEEDPRLAVWLLRAAIEEQPAARARMRPLRVGDTVTVGGLTLACARVGWATLPTCAPHHRNGTPQ